MKTITIKLFVFFVVVISFLNNTAFGKESTSNKKDNYGNKRYQNIIPDSENLLKRQLEYFSYNKAVEFMKESDYLNAAINALSIYPVDSIGALTIALSLNKTVKQDLKDYLFNAYKESVKTDPSIRFKEAGKTKITADWVDQKANWCDDFIGETIYYQNIKKYFKGDEKKSAKFFLNAYHEFYVLDKEKAVKFAENIKDSSLEYKILTEYNRAAMDENINISELENTSLENLPQSMKEMIATLKGDYYIKQEDYQNAKDAYLEYFELNYSLPVHIENLAICYMATGSYEKAKPLLVYLTHLLQTNNISVNGIYNLACIFAKEGNKSESIRFLEEAVERGFSKDIIKEDNDLKVLEKDKRFIKLIY